VALGISPKNIGKCSIAYFIIFQWCVTVSRCSAPVSSKTGASGSYSVLSPGLTVTPMAPVLGTLVLFSFKYSKVGPEQMNGVPLK
jgi:hypothetical protein